MTQSTSNLVALVTGANRGIGLETARQLATRGVTVLAAARDEVSIIDAARLLEAEGLKITPVVLDVTDDAQIETVRQRIERDFGRLDILINNAGIITGETFFENSSAKISRQALRDTFEVNVLSPVALSQALLPLLKAAPAARIVNVSSVLGSLATHADFSSVYADLKPLAYNASKAALNMATVNLAALLRDTPIKVNAAHPGWVKTDMGSEAAPMEVIDGARTSVELALLGADGPTGSFIHLGETIPW